jgi:hypothetical protein
MAQCACQSSITPDLVESIEQYEAIALTQLILQKSLRVCGNVGRRPRLNATEHEPGKPEFWVTFSRSCEFGESHQDGRLLAIWIAFVLLAASRITSRHVPEQGRLACARLTTKQ